MRRLTFLLTALLFVASGCVISPRRVVGGGTGTGSNSEFSLTASPTTQNVTAGTTANFSISVQPVNGFSGTVTLSATTSASGVVASLDSTTITGGSGSTNLTVQTSTSAPKSTATITVTGTDSSNNVSQNISVTASVLGTAATASAVVLVANAIVSAGCVNPLAGSGIQRISLPATPGTSGFTATFDATPSRSDVDTTLGFFAPIISRVPALS